MINTNYEIILKYIYENQTCIDEIMKSLVNEHIDSKLNAVRFIIDLFNNSKQLMIESRQTFFSQMIKPKLMGLLIEIMAYKDTQTIPTIKITESPETIIKKIVDQMVQSVVNVFNTPRKTPMTSPKPEKMTDLSSETKPHPKTPLKIEGESENHSEFDIVKLVLLKSHVAEILTQSLQVVPSIFFIKIR